jgi:hypothetical protein
MANLEMVLRQWQLCKESLEQQRRRQLVRLKAYLRSIGIIKGDGWVIAEYDGSEEGILPSPVARLLVRHAELPYSTVLEWDAPTQHVTMHLLGQRIHQPEAWDVLAAMLGGQVLWERFVAERLENEPAI